MSKNAAITSNKQWREVCGAKAPAYYDVFPSTVFPSPSPNKVQAAFSGAFAFVALLGLFIVTKLVRRSRAKAREARVRLEGDEVSSVVNDYGSITRETVGWYGGAQVALGDRPLTAGSHPEHHQWFI